MVSIRAAANEIRAMTPDSLKRAAALLLEARGARRWLPALPEDCRPADLGDAYAIQRMVFSGLGSRAAAWKVGAGSPEAKPACAAIADATLFQNDAVLPADMFNLIGAEAEIAYRIGRDLPPRAQPYSLDEIKAAVESVHPVIEISDTRFVAWASQNRPSHVADQLNHGALIAGAGSATVADVDPARQRATMKVNGEVRADVVGGNPAGDPLRLLLWLANVGAQADGGLAAGAVVTTGSLTGVIFVTPPVVLTADLPGLGTVRVTVDRSGDGQP
jgi:2-keto-4-pentenoate hydratase